MGGGKNYKFKLFLLLTLLSQSMVIPIMCRSQGLKSQKWTHGRSRHHGSPTCGNPPHGGGGGGGYVDPSTPPGVGSGYSHVPPSGGGSYHAPPSGGGSGYSNPPSSGGGHGGHGTPSPPATIITPATPSTPSPLLPDPNSPPSGGYYGSPSPPSGGYGRSSPPATIITPATPFTPSPLFPDPNSPPSIIDPSTPPFISSPPSITDPSSPPFYTIPNITPYIIGTCNYWRTHPSLIWALFGWGTLGTAFGVTTTPAFSSGVSLLQALANTRTDGYGQLYREGTASLLNSLASTNFLYTTEQVRVQFSSALVSDSAAAAQAWQFKQANERKIKLRS